MEDKCFCHFNGFAVKDAKARQEIENIKTTYATKEEVTTTYATKEELANIEVPSVEPVTTTGTLNCFDVIGEPTDIASGTWSLTMIGKIGFVLYRINVPAGETIQFHCDIPGNPTLINGGANVVYNDDNKQYILAVQKGIESGLSEFGGWCQNLSEDDINNLAVQVIFGIE